MARWHSHFCCHMKDTHTVCCQMADSHIFCCQMADTYIFCSRWHADTHIFCCQMAETHIFSLPDGRRSLFLHQMTATQIFLLEMAGFYFRQMTDTHIFVARWQTLTFWLVTKHLLNRQAYYSLFRWQKSHQYTGALAPSLLSNKDCGQLTFFWKNILWLWSKIKKWILI